MPSKGNLAGQEDPDQDHIDHCLQDAVGDLDVDKQRTIDEFKEITKYL